MDRQEQNPDSKVEFKEYMEIKPKIDVPTNNFYFSETADYSPVTWWFSLRWKNWKRKRRDVALQRLCRWK